MTNTNLTKKEQTISQRGRVLEGRVTSDKMHKTVTVEWERRNLIPKFERYEKRRSKVKAHNPKSINAKIGDIVRIKETRPLSKTKHFIVIEILNKENNNQTNKKITETVESKE